MSEDARISIVLATCNGGRFLAEQLESFTRQTVRPDEIVIGDDGSTDDTVATLETFARTAGCEVRLMRHPVRLGPARNFAELLGQAAGGLIVFSDQDDRWRPDKLQRIRDAFARAPRADFAFSDGRLIDERSLPTGSTLWAAARFSVQERQAMAAGHAWRVLLRRNVVTGATLAIRRRILDVVLPVAEGWLHDAWIVWMLAATSGGVLIEEPLIDYRVHAAQQIGVVADAGAAWRLARTARAETFAAEADAVDRLRERLLAIPGLDADIVDGLAGKAEFLRFRARLVRGPRILRGVQMLAPRRLAGYRRFALGWRSAALDALAHG